MPTPVLTLGTAAAFGRHVMSYSMGAVTAAAALHVLSNQDAAQATNALQQIASGVTTLVGGLATMMSLLMGLYAGWTATPTSQAKSLVQSMPGTLVITDPALAAATPAQPQIISQADVMVKKNGT